MTLTIANATVNTTDPRALSAWWIEALGGKVVADHGDFIFISATPISLGFQKVDVRPGGQTLHLDLVADDRDAEVARLKGLGATVVAEHEVPGISWTILLDPDGNEFCVADAH